MLKQFREWHAKRKTTTYGCLKPALMEDNKNPEHVAYRNWVSCVARLEEKDADGTVVSSSGVDIARYDTSQDYRDQAIKNARVPRKPLSLEIKDVWKVMSPWYTPWRWDWKELGNQSADVGNWIINDIVEDWAKAVIYATAIALLAGGPSYYVNSVKNSAESALIDARIAITEYERNATGSTSRQFEGILKEYEIIRHTGIDGIKGSTKFVLTFDDENGSPHKLEYIVHDAYTEQVAKTIPDLIGKKCIFPADSYGLLATVCETD